MLHRKSLLKYSAIISVVGILTVILFNVCHVPILTGIGNILVVDDPLSNADIIYCTNEYLKFIHFLIL